MRALAVLPLAFLLMACPPPEGQVFSASSPEISQRVRTQLQPLLEKYEFDGTLQISGGPMDGAHFNRGKVWPWASITKQVMAVLVMQEVEAGRLSLDAPVSAYLPDWPESAIAAPSLRQLLRHQSGLYDPQADPGSDWAAGSPVDPMTCVQRRGTEPGGEFSYNNCDTLLVGRVLEVTTGSSVSELFDERIADPLKLFAAGFATPETRIAPNRAGTPVDEIARYGAAGGMVGTATDLLDFDNALMSGRLLGEEALAEMWRGDPALGYTALGQWEATLPLEGCDQPVRIIERRGAIGGYQARNFILPELGIAVVAFIGRGEDEYPFGEAWSQSGLSYELLSAAACGA